MTEAMFDTVVLKKFQPHQCHMTFSIAHYPLMKLLLHICIETKRPAVKRT